MKSGDIFGRGLKLRIMLDLFDISGFGEKNISLYQLLTLLYSRKWVY
jgi:hypothetical protein